MDFKTEWKEPVSSGLSRIKTPECRDFLQPGALTDKKFKFRLLAQLNISTVN
jgi:hypothetical protein